VFHHSQLQRRTDLEDHNRTGYRLKQHKLVSGYPVQHHFKLFKRAFRSPGSHRMALHVEMVLPRRALRALRQTDRFSSQPTLREKMLCNAALYMLSPGRSVPDPQQMY
jgi:hypothetical protein